ncbi:MAG: aryl-sulfate sulfotransferase [Ignavibacteriae bacterium]|nr:aryl-sulfate sulfotransferase [Ignavibacteriota bacterium]
MRKIILILFTFLTFFNNSSSQTIGLFQHDAGTYDNGYVLFAPISYTQTYLIDKCGKLVHSWASSYRPGLSAYLLQDGNLLRTGNLNNVNFNGGGRGGIIEKYNWNSNLIWSYTISSESECQHHDIKPLENGNILVIVWDKKTAAEAIAMGRNPAIIGQELWTEKIIELHPTGSGTADIVWQWNVWDNLIQDFDPSKPNYGIIADHPDKVNINFAGSGPTTDADWLHINSVDYNNEFNQVMLSVHDFSEIWIIDRDLDTNGKLVYRWGNPQVYQRGIASDQKLFAQHNAQWISAGYNNAGKILVFNNGLNRPGGNYSSIDIIEPPVDINGNYSIDPGMPYAPANTYWSYHDSIPSNFYGMNISGVQALNNGNFLICNGPSGEFFEIDSSKIKLWKYVNPVSNNGPLTQGSNPVQNSVFKTLFYSTDYSGFNGHTLIPGDPIELNPINYSCDLTTGIKSQTVLNEFKLYQNYPNPFNPVTNIEFGISEIGQPRRIVSLKVYNISGKEVAVIVNEVKPAGYYTNTFNGENLPSGIYFYTLTTGNFTSTKKMLLLK